MTEPNGFEKYQKLILFELERLADENKEMDAKIASLESRVSILRERIAGIGKELRFKSGVWGAVGAAIPTAIAIIWLLVDRQ